LKPYGNALIGSLSHFIGGVPYERTPHPDDCAKARLAVDLGADIVVAHHPHIIQPFEIYKRRAIFYSIGNFAFGSGNSRAEGLLVAVRFEPLETIVDLYPIYVKNRDPRVNYQPKVLVGSSGHKILARLCQLRVLARVGCYCIVKMYWPSPPQAAQMGGDGSVTSSLRRTRLILSMFSSYRVPLALSTGCNAFDALLTVLRPWPLKVVIDSVIPITPGRSESRSLDLVRSARRAIGCRSSMAPAPQRF